MRKHTHTSLSLQGLLLGAAFLAGAVSCVKRDPYPFEGQGAFITTISAPVDLPMQDVNLYVFDMAGNRLLDQRYSVSPSTEFIFPGIAQGGKLRVAAIANVGERRLPSGATFNALQGIEFELDSLSAAGLHKTGSWLLASSRDDRDVIVEVPSYPTDTAACGHIKVRLRPVTERIGLRVDATNLSEWGIELRVVRLVSRKGTYLPWARTFVREGMGTYPQVPTSKEFVDLQAALSSRQRSPIVYFNVPDSADPEESDSEIQVRAYVHNRLSGVKMYKAWSVPVKDCVAASWKPGMVLSATLVLNDGDAGVEGQWSSLGI